MSIRAQRSVTFTADDMEAIDLFYACKHLADKKRLRIRNEACIAAVLNVCKNSGYPESQYSVLAEKDGTVCLVRNHEARKWEAFLLDGEDKCGLRSFNSLEDACLHFLDGLSYSIEDKKEMQARFRKMVEELVESAS